MNYRPIITLLVLAMFVPELVTGSTALTTFVVHPELIVLYFIGYGLPVLLIRELAVRYKIGLRGVVFFGIAYGILNEGLMAKTIIARIHLPVPQYDNYGYALGLSFPWAAGICCWHAFASVIFPIGFAEYIHADKRHQAWLSSRLVIALALVDLLLASAVFLGKSKTTPQGMPQQYLIMVGSMILLLAVGYAFKGCVREYTGAPSFMPILLGASIFLPFNLGLAVIAGHKLNIVIYFATLICVFLIYSAVLKRLGWLAAPALLCFGIGWYIQNAVLSFVYLAIGNPTVAVISIAVDVLILGGLWWRICVSSRRELSQNGNTGT